MQKNSDIFSPEEAARAVESPEGQQLLALMRRSDSEQFHRAAASAASGDYESALRSLSAFLQTPEARSLLEKLKR